MMIRHFEPCSAVPSKADMARSSGRSRARSTTPRCRMHGEMSHMTLNRCLSLGCVALWVTLAASSAHAQLAPTGGHYGGRASDTGYEGAVNSSGGYQASVPLDLPAARGGL